MLNEWMATKVRKSIGKVEMSSLRKEMKVEFKIFHWSGPNDNRFVGFIKKGIIEIKQEDGF